MTLPHTTRARAVLAVVFAASGCVPDANVLPASTSDVRTTASGGHSAATAAGGQGGQGGQGGSGGGLGGNAGHGGQGGQGGAACAPACADPAEPDCETILCADGACTTIYQANGTKLPDAKQTPANCKVEVCDGAGNVVDQGDDGDVPNDHNDCTLDTCSNGAPTNEPVAVGTPCAGGTQVCGAASMCVACNVDADCKDVSKPSCDASQCVPAGCKDGKKNGDETDVDCGGSCAGCATNQVCAKSADCLGQVCTNLKCAAPTCNDGLENGAETAVDCGGGCKGCGPSLKCGVDADCAGKQCDVGTHTCTPNCSDGAKNNAETGVDCGGGTCGKCADGQACKAATDCSANGCCNAPAGTCSTCCDGVKNNSETGVDCGGSCAKKCADGTACTGDGDCLSALCETFICKPSSCSNGSKDVGESDVDCGGPCQPCIQGKLCGSASDCAAGFCTDGVCCNAGCGGLCEACIKTKTGLANGDCQATIASTDPDGDCAPDAAVSCKQSGMCDGKRACSKYDNATVCAAASCAAGAQTAVRHCDGFGTCVPGAQNACAPYICGANACNSTCANDNECTAADYCDLSANPKVCRPELAQGGACGGNNQCLSGTCIAGKCASPPVEVCNFVDDDGDGQVDEGSDWTIGSFTTLFATANSASVAMALTLANGSVVVAGGDGSYKALLFRTDGTGKLLEGPLPTTVPMKGIRAHVITEMDDGIAQVISSTNYLGCNAGCPVQLRTYAKAPLVADAPITPSFGFKVSHVSDVAWTGSALAMWVVEASGAAHVVWLSKAGAVLKDQSLAALGPSPGEAGKLAVTASGVTWSAAYGAPGASHLYTGTFSLDGAVAVVAPTSVVASNNPSPPRWEGVLAGPGTSAILPYFDDIAASAVHLLRIVAGVPVAGPQAFGLLGDTPRSTVNVDVNVVSLVTSAADIRLYRLRRDTLAPVPTPGAPPSSFSPEDDLTLASVSGGMLIVRGDHFGGHVSVAKVSCK